MIEEYLEAEVETPEYCPMCDGESYKLGQLGNLVWYKCRMCGMQFNIEGEE